MLRKSYQKSCHPVPFPLSSCFYTSQQNLQQEWSSGTVSLVQPGVKRMILPRLGLVFPESYTYHRSLVFTCHVHEKRCMLVQHHMPHVDIPKQYLCSLVWRLREALPYTYHDWGWFIQPIIMMILGMVSYWVSRFPRFPHYFFSCFYFIV